MKPGFTVWLEEDGRYILGEKEASILEGIKKFGSFMATAKSLGMTYAHVWIVVDELSKRVGEPVVRAQRGGETGGGAVLTDAGNRFLEEYKALEEKVSNFLGSKKEFIFIEFKRPDLAIIGSSCVGVKVLAEMVKGLSTEVVEVGSSAGITAVMLGEADVAGIHLFDEESKTYNVPFVRRAWPSGMAVLIRGYTREQGLMMKRGNPKHIRSIEDLRHRGVRLINRNLGSGTRELLDRLLREHRIAPKDVKGYDFEVRTHEEVARAVEEGRADVGLGLRATASVLGLDFVKVCEESFDFVVERRRLGKSSVRAFIEALKSPRFGRELEGRAPGINTLPDTGKVLDYGK
ncbi:MAG: LysR family transcriptional regulator [Candidatus Verstraetearchaeota archaeon]|nr:LysR family transcriptional regulator [Candidatus Verstraetearchaeota archaeon]